MSTKGPDPARATYVGVLAWMIEEDLQAGELVDEARFEELRNSAIENQDPTVAAEFLDITFDEAFERVDDRYAEQRRRGRRWRRHSLGLDRDPEDRLHDADDDGDGE